MGLPVVRWAIEDLRRPLAITRNEGTGNGRRMRMFALPPDVKSAIATQNDLVRADLPSRFASITLVSLLSLFFVPIPVVATIYLVYGLIEIIGVYVYKRLSKEVTIG